MKYHNKSSDAKAGNHEIFRRYRISNVSWKIWQAWNLEVKTGVPCVEQNFLKTKLNVSVFELMQIMFDIFTIVNIMCCFDLDFCSKYHMGMVDFSLFELEKFSLQYIVRAIQRNEEPSKIRQVLKAFYNINSACI